MSTTRWPGTAPLKSGIRGVARRAGFDITRSVNARGGIDDFLPFEPTIRAAQSAGLSLGDYIDEVINGTPGATKATIDGMRSLGVFADETATVLEIGPGSGRYLERIIEECAPSRYEIYETAAPWTDYLVDKFGVVAQPTSGSSLAPTPDSSVDLVQAHKVFCGVTFLISARNFLEMARVARPGGRIVFDVMTETCLDPDSVRVWAERGEGHDTYPAAMPRQTCVDLFGTLGCTLVGGFTVPMGVGSTEVLVFRKEG